MEPLRLYIENFTCHSNSYIDFTQFNSALIIGKVDNNDLYSNGVGKTSIFKAIEYVLFNQADMNLEKIIRDDTSLCRIVFDFSINKQEYRVARTRTKKSTDLSLFQKKNDNLFHIEKDGIYEPIFNEEFWKDISGRRAIDTEKELNKLIKINYKSFRTIVHFLQNDFTGLSTATPEKRKGILKDLLSLLVYSKLEKIAKDKSTSLSKDAYKHKTLIDNIEYTNQDLIEFNKQLLIIENSILEKNNQLLIVNNEKNIFISKLNNLINNYSILENNFSSLIKRNKILQNEKSKIDSSIKEFKIKKSNSIKISKSLIDEISSLKEIQLKLEEIDFSQIDIVITKMFSIKEKITYNNVIMQNNILKYDELKIPIPNDDICKHCRQKLTDEHKKNCIAQIEKDMLDCISNIEKSKKNILSLNNEVLQYQQLINNLNCSKQKLSNIIIQLTIKNKELQDKKSIHDEYVNILNSFLEELSNKELELENNNKELEKSSIEEANNIKKQIDLENNNIEEINNKIFRFNKEIAHLNNSLAVIKYNIEQKNKDIERKDSLQKNLSILENKLSIYQLVIQAFSSYGIPNLIIQNVLNDLQIEANNILLQLKPELQLSFVIEKTKTDGTQDDTLDINYFVNGKNKDYEQLSGAMKLEVAFSLKLGLSFLLQKMIGIDIKFLLLDEIDQSLDKASIDAFADIIKIFQNQFKILVITHNDRLKDKFNTIIQVQQDKNMVSSAKLILS